MANSFRQIRNRSFLTKKPSTEGDFTKCLFDLKRDLSRIKFNNKFLYDILLDDLNIDSSNMSQLDKITTASTLVTSESISSLFKKQLLSFCNDEKLLEQYIERLSRLIYQWGLLYAAAQSLIENESVADKGYIINNESLSILVNIYEKEGEIYIDEKTQLMAINQLDGINITEISNSDNSSLLTIKNRFHIRALEMGEMEYAHTDLTIEYNSSLAEKLFDIRSFMIKTKDLFKSIFSMNEIKEFSLDSEQPSLSM